MVHGQGSDRGLTLPRVSREIAFEVVLFPSPISFSNVAFIQYNPLVSFFVLVIESLRDPKQSVGKMLFIASLDSMKGITQIETIIAPA